MGRRGPGMVVEWAGLCRDGEVTGCPPSRPCRGNLLSSLSPGVLSASAARSYKLESGSYALKYHPSSRALRTVVSFGLVFIA